MLNAIGGWKTKWGIGAAVIGGALLAGAEVAPVDSLAPWLRFIGTILVAIGGGGATYGLAHKVEKTKAGQSGKAMFQAMAAVVILGAMAVLLWQ